MINYIRLPKGVWVVVYNSEVDAVDCWEQPTNYMGLAEGQYFIGCWNKKPSGQELFEAARVAGFRSRPPLKLVE